MDKRRKWMSVVLEQALRLRVLEPADIIRHATPSVLATDLPPPLVAEVLQAGMKTGSFNPDLVIGTLGAENLARHVPLPVLWSILYEVAEVIIAEHPLTQGSTRDVAAPGAVSDEMPEIEVLEG